VTKETDNRKTEREIAKELRANGMRCNCDLDNWEPERITGHSWVCRIHKEAIKAFKTRKPEQS
jgi:hypothetical protein